MDCLNDFYKDNKYRFGEGFSQQISEQTEVLKTIVSNNSIVNVMEIGFHGGHSAETFYQQIKI